MVRNGDFRDIFYLFADSSYMCAMYLYHIHLQVISSAPWHICAAHVHKGVGPLGHLPDKKWVFDGFLLMAIAIQIGFCTFICTDEIHPPSPVLPRPDDCFVCLDLCEWELWCPQHLPCVWRCVFWLRLLQIGRDMIYFQYELPLLCTLWCYSQVRFLPYNTMTRIKCLWYCLLAQNKGYQMWASNSMFWLPEL